MPGAAVDAVAEALLFDANGAAAGVAEHAIDAADGVAAGDQQGLQFATLDAGQAGVVGGPGRGEGLAALQAVGQVGDGQGVAFGGVVAVDGVEVAKHQKGRAARAGGQHEPGRGVAAAQRAAVDAGDATGAPAGQRLLVAAAGVAGVEAGRQAHFVAPGFAFTPAGFFEEVGGGGQRIGHAAHQVTPAVVVEIHREAQEGGGHELGVAKGARPRAGELLGLHVAGIDDLERIEKLAPEVSLAAAVA